MASGGHAIAIRQEASRLRRRELWDAQDLDLGRIALDNGFRDSTSQGTATRPVAPTTTELRRFDMDTIAKPNALMSTDFLAAHLDETSIRVIDVDEDTMAYDQGHIRDRSAGTG
jgi:hypothetical protein